MSPLDNKIKDKIKETIMSLDPEAEVYIYGSPATGGDSIKAALVGMHII